MTRTLDFSEQIFHKTLRSEHFFTSPPPTSQNFPLFRSSLVRWKWAHLGGGFHKPDVFLPPFPPSSHYSDYQHCHSEPWHHPHPPPPQSCCPNLMWPRGLRWCADAAFPRDGERQRWLLKHLNSSKEQQQKQNGYNLHGFHWEEAQRCFMDVYKLAACKKNDTYQPATS